MASLIELLHSQTLSDFPSGSSVNYHNGHLFFVGDDAHDILVLDSDYNIVKSIPLFANTGNLRIPKKEKSDLEGSVITQLADRIYLVALGSGSKRIRKIILIVALDSTEDLEVIDTSSFIDRIEQLGLEDVNLEGMAVFRDQVILACRGNRKVAQNHLILTSLEFWRNQRAAPIFTQSLNLPGDCPDILGVSELYYIDGIDTLLLTLSSEDSDNSYDDGAIGSSYLGWINNFSNKQNQSSVNLDALINLSSSHPEFVSEKIEGICLESFQEGECIAHLVSDNDNGMSKVFKIRFTL